MHNPYRPPEAAVADVSAAGGIERPLAVRRAVQMLWASNEFHFVD